MLQANLLGRMSKQASRGAVARWARAIGLALALLFPSSFNPVRAQTEPPAPTLTCKQPEWDTIKSWLPAGARIELLVAASNTIPTNLWPRYKEAATAILACAGEGAVIEVLPITDSGASIAPLLIATVPVTGANQLRSRLEREAFVKHSIAAVDTLYTTTATFTGFDPLGTLQVAGESMHHAAPSGKLVVVMIGNGWQQTDRINLFRWHDNPAKHADEVVRQLEAEGTMPNLAGADVVVTGLTRGDPRLKMGTAEFTGLRTFWKKIVDAGHGKLVWDQAFLPGMTAPLQQ